MDGVHLRGAAEASELGLAPGEWPTSFDVEGLGTFVPHQTFHDGSREYGIPFTLMFFVIWND